MPDKGYFTPNTDDLMKAPRSEDIKATYYRVSEANRLIDRKQVFGTIGGSTAAEVFDMARKTAIEQITEN